MRSPWLLVAISSSVLLSTSVTAAATVSLASTNHALHKRASFGNKSGNFQPSRDDDKEVEDQVIDALAVEDIDDQDGKGEGEDTYILYEGDGSTDDGWPDISDWVSFEDMWNVNHRIMETSCQVVYHTPNNSDDELDDLRSAINKIAEETLLDHRFIFAIIMQESGGCVRAPTTDYGVRNPGLMQDHNGEATCNEGGILKPCPKDLIEGMIRDGTAGTEDGDGLVQCLNDSGKEDVSAYYIAARCYNSGSVAKSGALEQGVATHCYASDVANRLMGWAEAEPECWFDG